MAQFMNPVSASVTRPADTTVYTAGDVIADATSSPSLLTFVGAGRDAGHGGTIISATMIISASTGTAPGVDLFLFSVAPTAMEDNAAFDPTDAEMLNCVGVIQFAASNVIVALASGNSLIPANDLTVGFKSASTDKNLYGVPVERSGYTPISAEVFQFTLNCVMD